MPTGGVSLSLFYELIRKISQIYGTPVQRACVLQHCQKPRKEYGVVSESREGRGLGPMVASLNARKVEAVVKQGSRSPSTRGREIRRGFRQP